MHNEQIFSGKQPTNTHIPILTIIISASDLDSEKICLILVMVKLWIMEKNPSK